MDNNVALLTLIGELKLEVMKSQNTITSILEANESLGKKAIEDNKQMHAVMNENHDLKSRISIMTSRLEEYMAEALRDTIPAIGKV